MKLTSKFRIKDFKNINDFLNKSHVGRLATIDSQGFPQIIPMNFVYLIKEKNNNLIFDDSHLSEYKIQQERQRHQEIKKLDILNSTKEKTINNNDSKEDDTLNINKNNSYNFIHSIYMHSHHIGEKIDNIKRNSKVGFEVDREICFLPSYYFHPTDASFADTLYISTVIKGNANFVTDNEEKAYAMNKMMQKYQTEGGYEKLSKSMKSIQHLTVIRIDVKTIDGKYKIGQQWPSNYRIDIAKKIIKREGTSKAAHILKELKISILPNGEIYSPDVLIM